MAETCNIDELISNVKVIQVTENKANSLYFNIHKTNPGSFKKNQKVYIVENFKKIITFGMTYKTGPNRPCKNAFFNMYDPESEFFVFGPRENSDTDDLFGVHRDDVNFLNSDQQNHQYSFYIDNPNTSPSPPPPQPAADAPESAGQENPENQENRAVKRLFMNLLITDNS